MNRRCAEAGWLAWMLCACLAAAVLLTACTTQSVRTFRIDPEPGSLAERAAKLEQRQARRAEPFGDWFEPEPEQPADTEQLEQAQDDLETAQRVLMLVANRRDYTFVPDASPFQIVKRSGEGEPTYAVYATAEQQGRQIVVETWIDPAPMNREAKGLALKEQLQLNRLLVQQLGNRFPQRVTLSGQSSR